MGYFNCCLSLEFLAAQRGAYSAPTQLLSHDTCSVPVSSVLGDFRHDALMSIVATCLLVMGMSNGCALAAFPFLPNIHTCCFPLADRRAAPRLRVRAPLPFYLRAELRVPLLDHSALPDLPFILWVNYYGSHPGLVYLRWPALHTAAAWARWPFALRC